METLSYGYKKPTNGDSGGSFFPALEHNISRLNDHSHDGLNSTVIPSTAIALVSQSLASFPWEAAGAGVWKKTVTIPSGKKYENLFVVFRDAAGDQVFLDVKKSFDADNAEIKTQYCVYSNDNTLVITAFYVS